MLQFRHASYYAFSAYSLSGVLALRVSFPGVAGEDSCANSIGGTNVQSVVSLQKLGEIDREMIEHRVRTLCERRAAGDIPGMLEYFAADIVCHVRGRWTAPTFSERIIGKAAVAEAYRLLNIQYENLGSLIHELLIDGDRVALHRTTTVRNRGAGQTHTFDVFDFVRFRDGLVVEFSEYPDLAAPPMHGELRS